MKSCSPSLVPIAARAWILLSLGWILSCRRTSDSLHLPFCARQGLEVKFCYSCQSSWESQVLTLRSCSGRARKALTMQLALCSNDKDLLWIECNF